MTGTFDAVDVGADSGGTFTDVVGADGTVLKLPSTPEDPGRAVREGVSRLGDSAVDALAHGTTVATNALLERRVAPVALVCTAGLGDVVEIARQDRPSLYDPWVDRPEPLVTRRHRLEVTERLDAQGGVLVPLDPTTVPEVPEGVEAVAVCLLHADLEPFHEQEVARVLRDRGVDVCASHEVAPEFREYERSTTTVVNAALRPVCRPYLRSLADVAPRVSVMTSAGGLVDLATAAELPATLLLSGPAAGVRAAAAAAAACGFADAVSFDMGGTSTDVCLVLDGEPAPAAVRDVAGWPIRLPALDIHTIGAGGGSVASIDAGGALQVGPESAGAVPGPACYGRGGTAPTVTDADLLLGRIPAGVPFPGLGRLDLDAARAAFGPPGAGLDPEGVLAVVDAAMVQALRSVSVERGIDPARLALVAFGGAGPLHACALASAVGMGAVIVPAAAGVLSAVGLVGSPLRRELVQSWNGSADGTAAALDALAGRARALVATAGDVDPASVQVRTALDCRYAGQSHELRVERLDDFAAEHRRVNGVDRPGDVIEVTALRAVADAAAAVRIEDVLSAVDAASGGPDAEHAVVRGPEVIARSDCTVWVPAGWVGRRGPLGALVLEPG